MHPARDRRDDIAQAMVTLSPDHAEAPCLWQP